MIHTIEDKPAVTDINVMRRNLSAPRDGLSPAQRALAWHREELEKSAKWPERLMLIGFGFIVGALVFLSAFGGK